jgi:hypothetical protein
VKDQRVYEIRHTRRPSARTGFSVPAGIVHTRYAAIVAVATCQLCNGEYCNTNSWTLYQARLG